MQFMLVPLGMLTINLKQHANVLHEPFLETIALKIMSNSQSCSGNGATGAIAPVPVLFVSGQFLLYLEEIGKLLLINCT